MNVTEYRSHPAVSYSKLKAYLKSPLHGLTQQPPAESAAMRFGSLVDLMVKDSTDFLVNPFEDGRTKAAKEYKQANAGKLIVSEDEYNRAFHAVKSIKNHLAVQYLCLNLLEADKPLFGTIDGVEIKGLPDWWLDGTIIDLKTTGSGIDPVSFARNVDAFQYDLQAAVYCELARQHGDTNPTFFWIACESEAPHDVAVYKATDRILEVGRLKLAKALENFKIGQTGQMLGISSKISELEMPNWYGRNFQSESF
jgi:hypothetical protein